MVAGTLYENGVDIGSQLMGATFSNPKGHFEDEILVQLHDYFLSLNATDWRYHGAKPLIVPNSAKAKLWDYYKSRTEAVNADVVIGAKDPRASLFLDTWQESLGERLRCILVYRDWRLAVSSILKRHSRVISQLSDSALKRTFDLQFWKTPDLAARMWLKASKAMLDYYENNSHSTLLFDHSIIVQQPELLELRAQKLGFHSGLFQNTTFERGLMQTSVPASLLESLSPEVIAACEELQARFESTSDLINIGPLKLSQSPELAAAFYRSLPRESVQAELPCQFTTTPDFNGLEWDDVFSCLQQYTSQQAEQVNWHVLVPTLDAMQLDKVFALSMRWRLHSLARKLAESALELNPKPWRYMQLGDVCMREKAYSEARLYFSSARDMSPQNATFYAKLSMVDAAQGDFEEARLTLSKAQALDAQKPPVVQAQTFLNDKVRAQQFRQDAEQAKPEFQNPIRGYGEVMDGMTMDRELGNLLDNYMNQSAFVLRDNRQWLNQACLAIPEHARQLFLDYMLAHFLKSFSESTLEAELLPLDSVNWQDKSTFNFERYSGDFPTVGVHIHVSQPAVLPEVFDFLKTLPNLKNILITCSSVVAEELLGLAEENPKITVVAVEHSEIDIHNELKIAAKFLREIDIVLKLHTGSSSLHNLAGWRVQQYWHLASPLFNEDVLRALKQSDLGLVIPNYHPGLRKHINWGESWEIANALSANLGIEVSAEVEGFPAGAMFWYKPDALKKLSELDLNPADFAQSSEWSDVTICDAILRLMTPLATSEGYQTKFVRQLSLVNSL